MDVLPIALKLRASCLLVGGGQIAWRKARLLLMQVQYSTLRHPRFCRIYNRMCRPAVVCIGPSYPCAPDLRQYRLVIAATDNAAVNAQVFIDCEALNVLVNSVDDPPHYRFIVPAIIDRSPLLVSITTMATRPYWHANCAPRLSRLCLRNTASWLNFQVIGGHKSKP